MGRCTTDKLTDLGLTLEACLFRHQLLTVCHWLIQHRSIGGMEYGIGRLVRDQVRIPSAVQRALSI